MQAKTLRADLQLLLVSLIWGLAFVAQRVGMQHMGPFTINGLRFALGSVVLLPVFMRQRQSGQRPQKMPRELWVGSLLSAFLLFSGATIQQVGMIYTPAGKAGFITGMYVILVPLSGFASTCGHYAEHGIRVRCFGWLATSGRITFPAWHFGLWPDAGGDVGIAVGRQTEGFRSAFAQTRYPHPGRLRLQRIKLAL